MRMWVIVCKIDEVMFCNLCNKPKKDLIESFYTLGNKMWTRRRLPSTKSVGNRYGFFSATACVCVVFFFFVHSCISFENLSWILWMQKVASGLEYFLVCVFFPSRCLAVCLCGMFGVLFKCLARLHKCFRSSVLTMQCVTKNINQTIQTIKSWEKQHRN